MAGKVIVRAPHGINRIYVFINGVKQNTKILGGDISEFDIDNDSEVYAFVNKQLKSPSIKVSGNEITELAVDIRKKTFLTCMLTISVVNIISPIDYDQPIYSLKGTRGRIQVYSDKCIIYTTSGTSSSMNGEKTIYYSDVVSVQYKRTDFQDGYLHLETASNTANNYGNVAFNENTFSFKSEIDNQMEEVQKFIKQKVDEAKKQKNAPVVMAGTVSNADELKKFKELLDSGIITQEEFDAKKKQLLGL